MILRRISRRRINPEGQPLARNVIPTPGIAEPRACEAYQRRCDMNCCCIWRLGETDGGGLATARVEGSTMGMALRVRWASGWCSFVCEALFCW